MPLRVKCSAGHLMMVPDHRAGTVLRCAHCGIDVQVPPAPGTAAKDQTGPRVIAPAVQRSEPRQASGPAARQSPRVAGHSTGPKSGINLPTVGMKKPSSPRTKAPSPPAEEKATPSQPPAPQEPFFIADNAPEAPPIAAVTDIVFLEPSPAPPPVVPPVGKKRPAHQTPPLESGPSITAQAKSLATPPPAKPSNRPRLTLTGTMLSPSPESPPEPIPPEKLAPKRSEPKKPEPAIPSARLSETRVESPREKRAEVEYIEKPARKAEPDRAPIPEGIFEPVSFGEIKPTTTALPPEPTIEPPAAAPVPAEVFHAAATVVDPGQPAEPQAPPPVLVLGVKPTPAQRLTVWQLAAALLAALLLSVGPSLWEISDYLSSENGHSVARWAFLLLMLGVVQFGCILLLVQVPDWSSVWIVTLQSLALAAIYAAVLGLTIITSGDSTLIGVLQLDYQYASGKAPPWCVCLAATYACLAFFAGRISAKWRKVLRQVQATEAAAAHA